MAFDLEINNNNHNLTNLPYCKQSSLEKKMKSDMRIFQSQLLVLLQIIAIQIIDSSSVGLNGVSEKAV